MNARRKTNKLISSSSSRTSSLHQRLHLSCDAGQAPRLFRRRRFQRCHGNNNRTPPPAYDVRSRAWALAPPRPPFPHRNGGRRRERRASKETRLEVSPTLLTALSSRPAQHQDMLLRLFVAGQQPGGPKGQVGKKEVSCRSRHNPSGRFLLLLPLQHSYRVGNAPPTCTALTAALATRSYPLRQSGIVLSWLRCGIRFREP